MPNGRWFAVVTADVIMNPHISTTAKAVYAALACYADRGGQCFPSGDLLALNLDVNRRTITRALDELETKGVIRREFRYTEGRQTSNNYTLLDVAALARRTPAYDKDAHRVDTSVQPGVDISVQQTEPQEQQ